MTVRTWDSLRQAKFCKNRLRRLIPLLGKFIPKITNFGDWREYAHILRVTTVKFGVRVRTWDTLPRA